MFGNSDASGKHMMCDFKSIKNTRLLNSAIQLEDLLKKICCENNFEILKEIKYEFLPIGCSIIFLLAESHISIHTFPEKNYISFDLYTCRQYDSNDDYIKIYYTILTELEASLDSTLQIVDRMF
jgi:spermidine synthase